MDLRLFDIRPTIDPYNGVHIDLQQLQQNAGSDLNRSQIDEKIKEHIKKATEKHLSSLWVRIPDEHSDYISSFLNNGYEYHHAKKGYAMLYQWIKPNEIDRVPKYAHHVVGVGGLVYNAKTDKYLLVRERIHRHNISIWKLPGGGNDPGESFPDTAIREVFEETGVNCKFESVLLFRQTIHWTHGCSDLYVTCHLTPIDPDNCVPNKCDFEIEDCQWKTLDEAQALLTGVNKFALEQFVSNKLIHSTGNLYHA